MKVETTLPPLVAPSKGAAPTEDLTCGAGAELKRVREALRMTQGEIAAAVGLERTSITNIERGKQKLSLMTFKAIADALGMDVVIHLKPKLPAKPRTYSGVAESAVDGVSGSGHQTFSPKDVDGGGKP